MMYDAVRIEALRGKEADDNVVAANTASLGGFNGGPNEQPSMILGAFDNAYVNPHTGTAYHYVDIYP